MWGGDFFFDGGGDEFRNVRVEGFPFCDGGIARCFLGGNFTECGEAGFLFHEMEGLRGGRGGDTGVSDEGDTVRVDAGVVEFQKF